MTVAGDPSLEARLRDILIEESGLPADVVVAPEMSLEGDLDLDSLSRLSLSSTLEQEFAIEMTDETFDGLCTFGDVCDLVRAHVGA